MMKKSRSPSPSKNETGVVLLESLVAILLFSLGVLALVGLQAAMSKNVSHSKIRSEASFLANQLIGTMWSDQPNLANYGVTAGSGCTVGSNTNCTQWYSQIGTALPNGTATVTINGNAVSITMLWQLPGEPQSAFQIGADIVN